MPHLILSLALLCVAALLLSFATLLDIAASVGLWPQTAVEEEPTSRRDFAKVAPFI